MLTLLGSINKEQLYAYKLVVNKNVINNMIALTNSLKIKRCLAINLTKEKTYFENYKTLP